MKITFDNYNTVRNSFSSSLRKYIPKKSDLLTRAGELKVDVEDVESLFSVLEEYKESGAARRPKTGLELAFEATLNADTARRKAKTSAILSAPERIRVATSYLYSRTLAARYARDLARQSGGVYDKEFYSALYYLRKGEFDPGELSDKAIETLVAAYHKGQIDLSTLPGEVVQEINRRFKQTHGTIYEENIGGAVKRGHAEEWNPLDDLTGIVYGEVEAGSRVAERIRRASKRGEDYAGEYNVEAVKGRQLTREQKKHPEYFEARKARTAKAKATREERKKNQ